MAPESLLLLKQDGYTPAAGETYTITFAADGSLTFASVLTDYKSGKYADEHGKWCLEHDVSIDNDTKRANALKVVTTRSETMGFADNKGKVVLWTWYGDPDEGHCIDYVRE